MRFLFKYATRERPRWFKNTLQKYYSLVSRKHDYRFLITLNEDDETMNNPEMRFFMESYTHLEYKYDNYKTKIEAINADMEKEDFDILVVISDDMIPIVEGYDAIIVKDMLRYFPDLDGALHYNDNSHCGKKVISLSIMGKKLYDRFGYIYHPDYKSLWCDNEFTDIVREIGRVRWIDRCVIKHDWKGKKKTRDQLYKRNEAFFTSDQIIYNKRKAAGFPK